MNRLFNHRRAGFTLTETLIASTIATLVLASAAGLLIFIQNSWHEASVRERASQLASTTLNRMVYGAGGQHRGLRSSGQVETTATNDGWILNMTDAEGKSMGTFEYDRTQQTIVFHPPNGGQAVTIADSIVFADAAIADNRVALSVQTEVSRGRFSANHQLETLVSWRN